MATEIDMSTVAFDIRNPELVVRELEAANRQLAREPVAGPAAVGLAEEAITAVRSAEPRDTAHYGREEWEAVMKAAWRAGDALGEAGDERDQRRKLRVILEDLRFQFAQLAAAESAWDERPVKDVVLWLDEALSISNEKKGALFEVSDRTWQRWASESEAAAPSGDQESAVRLVARAVSDLRGVLTANGAVNWLTSSHDGEPSPLEAFAHGDIEGVKAVFDQIASARFGAMA